MGMLVIGKDWEFSFKYKNKQNRAKHRQNPRGKPSSVSFPNRHWEINSPFRRTITENTKPKYTLELLIKMTLNVPERPSYRFDLNRLENLWQDLKMEVK
jgi:hypothetical protein